MVQIYSANFRCKSTLFEAIKTLLTQTYNHRWQIYLAIIKKLQSTYKQDVFGIFWSIIMPIIPMTIYIALAHIKVFKTVENMPFVFYIAIGMTIWLLMTTTIHGVLLSIKAEKSILTTSNFPIFPIMLSKLGEVFYETIIRFFVIAIIVFYFNVNINLISILLALLSLIPAIIFALGVGIILSLFDILIQDIRRVTLLLLRYGLFVSSVIFPFPEEGIIAIVNQFNIFNTFVNATRSILYTGTIEHMALYISTSIFAIIVFIIASKLLYSLEYKIRSYL